MLARPLASETVVERAVWRLKCSVVANVANVANVAAGLEPCVETVGAEIVGAHGAYRWCGCLSWLSPVSSRGPSTGMEIPGSPDPGCNPREQTQGRDGRDLETSGSDFAGSSITPPRRTHNGCHHH